MSVDIQEEIKTGLIPIEDLDNDPEFNSRGRIAPIEIADLTKSIDTNGLQYPILVHKYNEQEIAEKGKKYRIVSGFRRFTAMKALGYNVIPCIIKEWMPETKARILNLEENMKRKDLNLLQEAKSIYKLKLAGYTQDMVANELGVSRSWVQVRYNVLDLPEDIQKEVANGTINQLQVKEIYSLSTEKQYEAIRKIKNAKARGEKVSNIIKKPVASNSKRARNKSEMNKMLEHIYDNLGPSLTTRALSWASGTISSYELFKDIKKEIGEDYIAPSEEF